MNLKLLEEAVKDSLTLAFLAGILVVGGSCACDSRTRRVTEPRALREVRDLMGLDLMTTEGPQSILQGSPVDYVGYQVLPVSFDALPSCSSHNGFKASGALWLPGSAEPMPGVLILPGHFGEGKSSGEVQELAHSLAARGIMAFAVDPPGVEEWDDPEHQLHFEAGAHNRAVLRAAGSSALALQVEVARQGLRVMRAMASPSRVAVVGVSGGAVTTFYLLLVEPSLDGGALVSYVTIPRELPSGGCPCDVLPGLPGLDPALMAAMDRPALWISETPRDPPVGLDRHSRHLVIEGPHGIDLRQRREVIRWLEGLLEWRPRDPKRAERCLLNPPYTQTEYLRSKPASGASIFELALARGTRRSWVPRNEQPLPWSLRCRGIGPVVLVSPGATGAAEALMAAGFEACEIEITVDNWEIEKTLAKGGFPADRVVASLKEAASQRDAVALWGAGGWGIPVAGTGYPFVLQRPVRRLEDIDPQRDDAWVHAPGIWWGAIDDLYGPAIAIAEDPSLLPVAIRRAHPELP